MEVRRMINRAIGLMVAVAVLCGIGLIAEIAQTRVDLATQETRQHSPR